MTKPRVSRIDLARAAAMEAARAQNRLGLNLSQRVDIFDVIHRSGILLMFKPLRGPYGAYLAESRPGILINANHPLNLQRFTAAHEFGHHVMCHKSSLDYEEQIELEELLNSPQEIAAQAFSAHFLMPLKLVNTALQRMKQSINPGDLTPLQMYKLSLECGVSYRAAITHLFNVHKISQSTVQKLYRRSPKDIKLELREGTPLKDPWADVWQLDEYDSGRILYPRIQDLLSVDLPEMPSTGYVWAIANEEQSHQGASASPSGVGGADTLLLLEETFEGSSHSGEGLRLNSSGYHRFKFQIEHAGNYSLKLVKRHPRQLTATPIGSFTVHLCITEKNWGLLEQQKNV